MKQTTRRHHAWRRLGVAALLFCVLNTPAVAAKESNPPPSAPAVLTLHEAAHLLRIGSDELEQLARRNEVPARRIGTRWRFNRATLLAWLNGDWKLIVTAVPPSADSGGAAPLTPLVMGHVTGTGTRVAQSQTEPSAGEEAPAGGTEGQEKPIGEAPEERTAEDVFLRGQRVLLAPGEVTLDLGLFYSESDNRQLANVSGGVGLATAETKTFTTSLFGRVGVFEETEVFASTSFRNQDSSLVFGSQELSSSSRSEFGDVRLGVRRTVLREDVGIPDVILTLDGRIPTGDTSYAVGGGIALVKSIDPVVLFANANYRHTFSRDFDDVTRLEPEDRIDATLGYAYALNDTLTLSTAVSGLFTGETAFDNATLRQQESFSLQFGLTSWLAKGLYIEPTVSFGLNGPGNSVVFGVSLPYTFEP